MSLFAPDLFGPTLFASNLFETGVAIVIVPDVSSVPTTLAAATAILQGVGLGVNAPTPWVGSIKITQYPTAGSPVQLGSLVSLFLPGGRGGRHARKAHRSIASTQKPLMKFVVKPPKRKRSS